MKRVMFGLVALAAIALMAPAQEQTPKQTKETVWTVQIRGISGWGAARTAKRARAALEKVDGIDSVVVDTTARGIIRVKKGKSVTKENLDAALRNVRCSVKSLEKTEIAKAVEAVTINVKGLGWQDTAQSIREMLENVDGVIVALPDGGDHKVLVHTVKKGALTEKAAKKMIEKSGKFKVTAFVTKSLVKEKKEAWFSLFVEQRGRFLREPASSHFMSG